MKAKDWSRSSEVRTPAENFHEKGTEQASGCESLYVLRLKSQGLRREGFVVFPGVITGDIFLRRGTLSCYSVYVTASIKYRSLFNFTVANAIPAISVIIFFGEKRWSVAKKKNKTGQTEGNTFTFHVHRSVKAKVVSCVGDIECGKVYRYSGLIFKHGLGTCSGVASVLKSTGRHRSLTFTTITTAP